MIENNRLADLIERGGVYHNLPGTNPKELLAGLVGILPLTIDPQNLLKEIMEREELVSTGIGHGIALPHPRNPPFGENGKPLVAIAFPIQPLDWNTPDGSKVDTVFLILSATAKQHLGALSKINFLCRQENFFSLIKSQAAKEEIIAAIRKAEEEWEANNK